MPAGPEPAGQRPAQAATPEYWPNSGSTTPHVATQDVPSKDAPKPATWSGGAAADQPDGRGDEQHRQREQPAALDPLEGPVPAAGLIAGPLRVAVPGQALPGRGIRGPRAEPG